MSGMLLQNKGLATNYGEAAWPTKREGRHVKFCFYEKGGAEKVLPRLERGA